MNRFKLVFGAFLASMLVACNQEPQLQKPLPEPEYNMTGFARGADVGWLTQMEQSGVKFYNAQGRQTECMTLMRELGMNSIRLRVWVNPADSWCNADDLLIKAFRAKQLGFRLMVDFHYSDVWADPGAQNKPAAWSTFSLSELETAVSVHTRQILEMLKAHDIEPEWVQVGNETGNGMLWNEGKASENMAQYAQLHQAGYLAVKEVFPSAKVIVHLQEGNKNSLFRWLFDGIKGHGAQWDVIGMSLYPTVENYTETSADMVANMNDMISRYQCEVMVCETGMPWDSADESLDYLTKLMADCKAIPNNKCLGVFYWEPQAYNGWNGYTLGAFDASGRPTKALDAFKN